MNSFISKTFLKFGQWTENQLPDVQSVLKSVKDVITKGTSKAKVSERVSINSSPGTGFQALTNKPFTVANWQQSLRKFKTTVAENASKAQQQLTCRNVLSENSLFRNDFIWRRARKGYMIAFAGLFLFQEEREESAMKLNDQFRIYDSVCSTIKTIFPHYVEKSVIPSDSGHQVKDFELHEIVQTRGNSITFAAELSREEDSIVVCNENICEEEPSNGSWQHYRAFEDDDSVVNKRDFLVEVIHPSGGVKNAKTLMKQAENQLICGGQNLCDFSCNNCSNSSKLLPPHPNVVKVERAFIDQFSSTLEHGAENASLSLSQSTKALYMVTKRYQMTLKQFLHQKQHNGEILCLMILQLLEAVAHLEKHNIVHRNITSETVFVDFDKDGYPHLLLGGFENSYCATTKSDLKVPFEHKTLDTRVGDLASQAPEVSTAKPGRRKVVNYEKSDAWLVGVLAYEMLTGRNIFKDKGIGNLAFDSRMYHESDLPSLRGVEAPNVLKIAVQTLLSRDPKRRPTAGDVADILHFELFATPPPSLLSDDVLCQELWLWVVAHCAEVFVRKKSRSVLYQLCQSFFTRQTSRQLSQTFNLWLLAKCGN